MCNLYSTDLLPPSALASFTVHLQYIFIMKSYSKYKQTNTCDLTSAENVSQTGLPFTYRTLICHLAIDLDIFV